MRPDLRPFPAIKPGILEKLFLIRKWNTEMESIPLKWPTALRTEIYPTGEPLVLREYEKQAIYHLAFMPRFMLGDGVGLGKTLDAIAAFCWLKQRFAAAKLVIICTKSTTYQWADEVERYSFLNPYVMQDTYRGMSSSDARYAQMIDFFTGKLGKDALITKYSSLLGSRKIVEGKFDSEGNPVNGRERLSEEIRTFSTIFKEHKDNIVLVYDESHKFKSTSSQTRNLVWNLSKWAGRVWSMTATAIKNNLEEFYSIATAIGIRPLGHMGDFRDDHCIYREQYIGRGRHKQILVGYKDVPEFKRQIRPFFLGRSQAQVKEPLPKLTTIYHPIDLDAKQTKMLRDDLPNGTLYLPPILFKVAGEAEWREKERDPDNLMTQLSVQQLVTNHWALLDRNNEKDFHTKTLSPKEETLLDMLDGEYQGEKVIVYTKYRTWIDRLQWLTENGHFTKRKFLRITGAENERQRNDNKKLFQDPNSGYDLIVINAAGMEGINLQQAAHMVLLDSPWSWGDLIQLVGRMVRMASPHSACTLHVMVAKGTIDEYTIETLKGKKGIFEKILGQSHSAGILDEKGFLDLESGMEAGGSEEEFRQLLKAHVKKIGMNVFLSGDQISRAKSGDDYQMVFERDGKKKPKVKKIPITEL
jgi:SNF2 family DNA or RNA helicase